MTRAADARRSLPAILAGGFTLAAAIAIINTYSVYSGTFDEPAHVAAGMEYLSRGQYAYEPLHPPLARVAVALGPYAAGARSTGAATMWREGRNVLYGGGQYTRNLSLARVGILPFFLLSALVVWTWTRRLWGDWAAAAGVALLVTTEPLLAHAGLATLDMALAATCAATFLAFTLWLERPGVARSILLGVSAAAALLSKFSALVYLPAGASAILACWWVQRSHDQATGPRSRILIYQSIAWTAVSAAFTVWAVYRFSVGPVTAGMPLPAPEFWRGLGEVMDHSAVGWEGYLLGSLSTTGWWYFFPLAVLVKTPLSLLLFAAYGTALAVTAFRRRTGEARRVAPIAAALCVLAGAMVFAPAIGVRQVLPVYPLVAVAAGGGVLALWNSNWSRSVARATVILLLSWQVAGAERAYPDFLPWFNALAGKHPESILVGSDLDWGQDLFRLVDTTQALGVDSLALAYFGSADPTMHFRHVRPLAPYERPAGWAAVSVAVTRGLAVPGGKGFEWLDTIPPAATVGASIRLYHFPAQ